MKQSPHIVCIGGGTGTFVALRGLKTYPVSLSAIVTMADSGGSNKRIRDEFGLLPTSDIRQCLVALADEKSTGAGTLRKLFMYRFAKGNGISGMTFGNLFMAALSDVVGSQKEAIHQTGKILRIHGTVIPVSFTDTNLYAQYEDGRVLTEEHLIDEPPHDGKLKIHDVYLTPPAQANTEALEAILHADMIVLGPGDLYTSIIPNLLVQGISNAIKKSKARKMYILNLMTKYGQTYSFTAQDHIRALEHYIGQTIDYVLVNTGKLSPKALKTYQLSHEQPVVDNVDQKSYYHVIRADLASRLFNRKSTTDALVRSLIRHDSTKLARSIMSIVSRLT